jgi:demethylmenaquinone methyltransferase / 2-methoxy-6-polyprenyl-1,4-benzoquinol methylase
MATQAGGYAHKLRLADILREPVMRRAIRDLQLNPGENVLDAGCGIGSHLSLLAEQVGPSGHVTGLDISNELISIARQRLTGQGLKDLITLVEGDVNNLPFAEDSIDCVVSVDCVGYPFTQKPVDLLRELGRVVIPGGTVAIMGWSHQQLLPGYPLLESRLNTASSLVTPSITGLGTESHFLRATGWFQEAGFIETSAKSYAGDISAPLSNEEKEAVRAFFEMLWENARKAVSNDEWQLFGRITSPGSSDCVLEQADYYGFFVYTRFAGHVP